MEIKPRLGHRTGAVGGRRHDLPLAANARRQKRPLHRPKPHYLFGFVGLLIAVPLAASIGVLVRFILRQQPASAIDCNVAETLETGVDLSKTLGERPLP